MSRIEHEHWACPICEARGNSCMECGGLGTSEDYYRVQELHAAAIVDEAGIAAQLLEKIATLPDLLDRAYWVSRMINAALQHTRAA